MRKFALMLVLLIFAGVQVVLAQTTVTGTVTSSEDGKGIPGATVLVKGTTVGLTTDMSGQYKINVPASGRILQFSFVGMKTKEVTIGNQTVINVVLDPDIMDIEGVVVTALGISREKKSLGYAVQDVGAEDLTRTGNNSLLGALQGKVAGVEIKPSSGMPGASSQFQIRGARSFTGDNTPLYVVDGMPISSTPAYSTGNSVTGSDISNRAIDINPADIESIEVLKGQAASALYGIRASNGVILITTKSGKNNKVGRPVVNFSHTSSFDQVSRTPDYQTTYAQGTGGAYNPTASMSWGPKINDLPNDPVRGGNVVNDLTNEWGLQEGKFYVPQLDQAGLNPWVTPQVFNNWDDYFQTGYTMANNISISQATNEGNFSLGFSNTEQTGIALNTGMTRYNVRANAERNLNKNFTTGFSANYSTVTIDKLSGANDGSLAGVLAAPSSYNLKGYPYHRPGEPTRQIYYRGGSFDNAYWVEHNNTFNENTNRFFGNAFINFKTELDASKSLNIRYQAGADTYTTHLQDIFGYGSRNNSRGVIDNYGTTNTIFNSLLTGAFDWNITEDFDFNFVLGNEINHENTKGYTETGLDFNFPGWNHIGNASVVTANEEQWANRTIGVFGSMSLSWKSMIFLNATGRNDIVSTMPRDNRTFFYPSVGLSFVATEMSALQEIDWLSYAKVRASYAEVGMADTYYDNFFIKPNYEGGFWVGAPITYPIGGISAYIPSDERYDPNLKPQNTKSTELGIDLKFFNNRFGIDYTYSKQNVTDQIFPVPLAGSTGASTLVMNGGAVTTDAHEIVLYVTPIKTKDFTWDINLNYTKLTNMVDELASGVESIFLGGFVTPQVRAGIGYTFPVIYGTSFVRDDNGNIVVVDNPGAWNHGFPQAGEPDVIGEVSPDFILNGTTSLSYKSLSLSAVFEWKQGGEMYSGSNGLLDLYGMSAVTEDRESTFIYPGVKPDGTPNDIVRGGPNDPRAVENLYANVLSNVDEYYIHENSFVKLREVSLRYRLPKNIYKTATAGISLYARNILIWSALRNIDPETSQGNTNMGGSFERFSLPQTTSYGFTIDVTF
ncbi:MAG: SusC/RagA family TonB-linked outer membrane protein [Lentimicrobium sp.]|uniref:SusC/RagA family TonB-linked outer membrane protein n=1 Tax=Lentimicrobium sp. TaxID=2034841 RepID=UPI0025D7083E|nr:SusC/RagA family TonB-linked outer membrane protein [Lentimicrobium sp.]MCO5258180.1 SusC/RagA family TonB-linked outer membrane protein [Lentimicrobium sp.]